MEISVVIPIYNAEKTIQRCLESMASQISPYPPLIKGGEGGFFELILVDNNSTDNSVKLIEDFISSQPEGCGYRIQLLHEPRQGSCAARNRGARAAKGKIIVNTDPDCMADKNWLRDIASAFDDTPPATPPYKWGGLGVGGVAGNIYGYNPHSIIEKFLSIFTLRGLSEHKVFNGYNLLTGGFATANLAIRKDVFEKIGGFDENINIFGEDHDLCARIYKAGYKIKTISNAVIYHIHRGDLKGFVKQCINFGITHSVLLKKHFPKGLFLELFRFTFIKEDGFAPLTTSFGIPVWLNLNSFDKKIFLLLMAGYFIPPSLIVIPLYLLYQLYDINKRAKKIGMTLTIIECLGMSGLLFIKSFSMTVGCICGSLKNRVLCI